MTQTNDPASGGDALATGDETAIAGEDDRAFSRDGAVVEEVAAIGEPEAIGEVETARPRLLDDQRIVGLLFGLGAYGWWGSVIPLYVWWLRSVNAWELLAHRIIWGLPILFGLIALKGRWGDLRRAITSRRTMAVLGFSTLMIACNWFGFLYAITTERTLQASLGYYINPLVSVGLGMLFLGERLRWMQWCAIAVAAGGVAILTFGVNELPWISLMLAFSFGTYGLLRKQAPVDAVIGLTVEMGLCAPLVLVFMAWWIGQGEAGIVEGSDFVKLGLVLGGVVTVTPLLWFTNAARRLRLSTIGFLQYTAPTGQLLLAVFLFGEPFSTEQAIAFSLIWTALTVFSIDAVRHQRSERRARKAERAS